MENKVEDLIAPLNEIIENHTIWSNPLLLDCESKNLTKADFQFLFSQYYLYSKNFTKLLAAVMVHCDNDYYRAQLISNLYEEAGSSNPEQRHSEIFKKFLIEALHIDIKNIKFELYTQYFVDQYLSLCLRSSASECASILAFGTEGIVSRLYKIMKIGLLNVGLNEDMLHFFNLHIACDDEHAITLQEITISYRNEPSWLERCKQAIVKSLDLRDVFFKNIYESLQTKRLNVLIKNISKEASLEETFLVEKNLHCKINDIDNKLYENKNLKEHIYFTVNRVPFNANVLDPRVVHIQPQFSTELHRHAHETIFLILSGQGLIKFGQTYTIKVSQGSIVYVPRWIYHQTKNTGSEDLIIFAITDYGLTKIFPKNSEEVYRLKPENVLHNTSNTLAEIY